MNANPIAHWLGHVERPLAPAALRRGGRGLCFDDAALHTASWAADPELYALSALNASREQQERVLYQLLASSWSGFALPRRALLLRVIAALACSLAPERVLEVFLGLRQRRANHKHTVRAILRYLFCHPARATLMRARRPTVVECLEHALGRDVARRCARVAATEAPAPADQRYLHKHVLRHAPDARALLCFLYKRGPTVEVVPWEQPEPLARPAQLETGTVNAFNRGELAAALTHVYRGGATEELSDAIAARADALAATLPHFDGRLGLVLDASASTRGYGEREHCCIAQSVAFELVLERACRELVVRTVGGNGAELPEPMGRTDLAWALFDVLETAPDLVAIVTDGYENHHAGDLARVVAALPGAGIDVPVVVVHSKFTFKDDLSLRRPVQGVPELEMWHERDFEGVYLSLLALSRGNGREQWKRYAERRLTALERRNPPWMHSPSRR
jgi:hypothetical protein